MQEQEITVKGNIGTFGEMICNNNGGKLNNFVLHNNMKVMNTTFFQHKNIHKYISSGRGSCSITDYVTWNKKASDFVLKHSIL